MRVAQIQGMWQRLGTGMKRDFSAMCEPTPNERRYLEMYAGDSVLGYRVLLAIYLPCFVFLVSAPLVFGWFLAQNSSKIACLMIPAALGVAMIAVIPIFSIWRHCRRRMIPYHLCEVHGRYAIRDVEESMEGLTSTAHIPTLGGTEVDFPLGWDSGLREGDWLHGHGCLIPLASSIGGCRIFVLGLDDGFSVDREVEIGLLERTGLGPWLAAIFTGLLWALGVCIWLFSDCPWLLPVGIPLPIFGTLLAYAVVTSRRDRRIEQRLDEFRQKNCELRTA